MLEQNEEIRTNKSALRVYLTIFAIGLATVVQSIILSEHKESVALFKMYPTDLETAELIHATKTPLSAPGSHTSTQGQFTVLNQYMIAEQRFVEGLEFLDDTKLIMSSGSYGNSHLDILDMETNPVKTIMTTAIDAQYFGEGITYLADRKEIIMMTYKKHKAFRFGSGDLKMIQEMTIPAAVVEGWGLTHFENTLFVSDGTSTIHRVKPENFEVISSFKVTENGREVRSINELEYVNGKIYANIFQSNDVIVFNLDG
jgi:glutamine cyclotransferase